MCAWQGRTSTTSVRCSSTINKNVTYIADLPDKGVRTMIKIPKKNVVSKDEVAVIQSGDDKIELGRTTYKVP